jgi:hypothetical protein
MVGFSYEVILLGHTHLLGVGGGRGGGVEGGGSHTVQHNSKKDVHFSSEHEDKYT